MLRLETYDDWIENMNTLWYGECECHGSETHELGMNCRCVVCYSNAIDILHDRQRDSEMEREWGKHPNQ